MISQQSITYNPTWITNGFLNIRNPTKRPYTTFTYSGPVEKYDMGIHKDMFEKLAKILSSYSIHFDGTNNNNGPKCRFKDIYVAAWPSKYKRMNPNIPDRLSFVVTTTNPRILWVRYEADTPSSAHNMIYLNDKKLSVNKVIKIESLEYREL